MSTPTHRPVTVNFNVTIDASGNINVFNAAAPIVTNVIVAEHTLLSTALYDPARSIGLFELWEPSDAQGDIRVQLANTDCSEDGGLNFSGAYQVSAKELAIEIQTALCDSFDCSGVYPFSNYNITQQYYKQRDFGRVALATYAHAMFGHVDATAAITNDKAFVEAMLSLSDKGDSEVLSERVGAYHTAKTTMLNTNVQTWSESSSPTDANLAIRLVKKLISKGLDSSRNPVSVSITSNSANTLSIANIIAQVVGQDASRLMDEDNSERTLNKHMLVRFYPGDVIYMNIRLKTPNVSIGSLNQNVSKNSLEQMYTEQNFTIKFTLAGPTAEDVTNYITNVIETIQTSPTTDVTQLKSYLAGFTTSNPAPAPTITVTDVPVTSLVTAAASSFDTNATYEVNFVLLTNNTATVDTTTLTENSVLYIPATPGVPVTLVTNDTTYTITTTPNNTVLVNGTSYALGQKVTIGGKQFVVAFTGSVGLIVQNSSPGIAKLATRFGNTEEFAYSSIACDSAGNVYVRVRTWTTNGFTIYNYASAPVNGGEIPTSIYGTIAGGSRNYLLKYNSSGICQWAVRTPTVRDSDFFNRIVCDSQNNIYIAGTNSAGSQTLYNFSSAPVNGGAVGNTQYGILATPNDQGWARQGYLIKYTTNGTVAWATRTLYIGGADFTSHSLTVDKDNNVYFGFGDRTGSTGGIAFHSYASPPANSTSNINTTLYGSFRPAVTLTQLSIFITKYNSSGQIQHIIRVGNISPDGEALHNLTCDNSGNLLLATPARNDATQTVIMYNPVVLTSSSGFFDFTQARTMNIGGTVGAAIVKFNSSGVVQWATCQQFPIWYTRQPCISCDNDNNIYYVTTMLNSGGGRPITYKSFSSFSGSQVVTTNYGTLMIGDGTAVHIAKLNSNGVMQWVTKIEGENTQFAFNSTSDIAGNVYIGLGHGLIGSAGSPRLFNYTSAPVNQGEIGLTLLGRIQNVGGQDVHLIKYNTNGSVVWGTRVAGTLDEQTCEVALDSTDHVWLTGIYRSNPITVNNYVAKPTTNTGFMSLEPFGTLADINTSSGQNNVFIAKFGV